MKKRNDIPILGNSCVLIALSTIIVLLLIVGGVPSVLTTAQGDGAAGLTRDDSQLETTLTLVEPSSSGGSITMAESKMTVDDPLEFKVKAEYVNNAEETVPADDCKIKLSIFAVDIVRQYSTERRTDDDGYATFKFTGPLTDTTFDKAFAEDEPIDIKINFTLEEQNSGSFTLGSSSMVFDGVYTPDHDGPPVSDDDDDIEDDDVTDSGGICFTGVLSVLFALGVGVFVMVVLIRRNG